MPQTDRIEANVVLRREWRQLVRLALESLGTGLFVSLVLALAVFIISFEAKASDPPRGTGRGDAATGRNLIMDHAAVDRGGSFGRTGHGARNWMRAGAPGIAFRCRPAESSPVDSGAAAARAAAERPRRKARLWLTVLIACAGFACLSDGLYIYAKAALAQVLLHAAWDKTQTSGADAKPWPWADTHPVARLIAPAQDADVLVLSGASGRTLAFGPGHLDGSALPGSPGNSVITAHRDTHFSFLRRVAAGDTLVVEGRDGARRHFHVRRTYVADFRALHIPRDVPVPTLTLVTCFPFDAIKPGRADALRRRRRSGLMKTTCRRRRRSASPAFASGSVRRHRRWTRPCRRSCP